MTSHNIVIGFPADAWCGPPLAHWEAGLVKDDHLIMPALGEHGADSSITGFVGCYLYEVESIRYCAVSNDALRPCLQAALAISGAGTVYVYASEQCLRYVEDCGVSVVAMEASDVDASRVLWTELCRADEELSKRICEHVNSTFA